jgi:hypothetical protein
MTPHAKRPGSWSPVVPASHLDGASSEPESSRLGVTVPLASVPDEARRGDDTVSPPSLRLPDALENRLLALEQAVACPWACGASRCPWRCDEVRS